jgi:putative ABC transport system permease protein
LVVKQGITLSMIGIGVGLPMTALMTRTISGLLFGVRSYDPLTLAVIAMLLLMVTILAAYLPARRATRVDPLVALRSE